MAEQASVISGALKRPFAEQVAFFRQKLGNLVPTAKWDDLYKTGHDRGFMVAGAAKADLLTDLAAATDRANSEGKGLEAFRKDFMSIIEKRGWKGYTGDASPAQRAWRTRVIYQTNMATSYAAGRYAQLQEGEFSLWVYHHNDSVSNPRQQHVAWNGVALPPGHAFWQSHYPPSAFGCHCYVSGTNSTAGVSRLGGDPDKTLPEGWDAIDPATGEQVGIGKGWGYAPGASVEKTVRTMAAKTQQWEYTLAKAYMQDVPTSVRDQLARAYRDLPSVADDTRRYAQRILEGRTHLEIQPYRTMGLLTETDVAKVRELLGAEVGGYDFALDQYAPLHIRGGHDDPDVEGPRGQRPIVAEDYARLPEILNNPDQIRRDPKKPEIIWDKRFGNDRQVAIFRPLGKRKTLNLVSMRVYSKAAPRSTS